MKKLSGQKSKKPLLLTPGPVLLSPAVQTALSLPMDHHRSRSFKKTLKQVSSDLKWIFRTKEPVLILHSTGTGAMEAALSNTLSPGEEALCVCAGKFGQRWREIGEAFGLQIHSLNIPLGSAVQPKALEKELKRHKRIRALLISACETSTATEQPLKEISRIVKKHPELLFIVDGVTGVGAMELPMDKWGIDVLVAGSQKSFMLPAGLSFVALSQKAWQAVESSTSPRYYFDLKKEKEAQAQGETAFSSSVTLIRALGESLKLIKKESLKSSISKCRAFRNSTHAFCKSLNLLLYSSRPAHSVTAIKVPEPLSAGEIKKNLEEGHGVVLAGGQGPLKGKILRIGHLGPLSKRDHLRGLKALAWELNKQDSKSFDRKKVAEALRKAKKPLEALKKNGKTAQVQK